LNNSPYSKRFAAIEDFIAPGEINDTSRFPSDAGPFASKNSKAAWHRMNAKDRKTVNEAFASVGKMIAAYLESLTFSESRFDRFANNLLAGRYDRAREFMTLEEEAGLRLFINDGRAPCIRCHNGPAFSNYEFHNIGTGLARDGTYDMGRFVGLRAAMLDEFNCHGEYSDATIEQCDILNFAGEGHVDEGAFKVPTLRNIADTAPYMHDGRFSTLGDVIAHYRDPPDPQAFPHEVPDFSLTDEEADQLLQFLVAVGMSTLR
jgi:cytochrome c peroxidase